MASKGSLTENKRLIYIILKITFRKAGIQIKRGYFPAFN